MVTSILQFPIIEHAWAFWNDPEHQRVVPLRQAGSTVVIIDGAEAPAPFAQSPTAPLTAAADRPLRTSKTRR